MDSRLDQIVEECLARMEAGESLADCLAHYPESSAELRPILEAAQMVGTMSQLGIRPEFRAGARARLIEHMHTNPRKAVRFNWRQSTALRYAASMAVVLVAFATAGTALAQRALPGDALYTWKLTSESFWRSLQQNQFDADYYLAQRRLQELQAVQGYPDLEQLGVQIYSGVLRQLRDEVVKFPDRVDWLNQLFVDHREQLEALFANSQAELPSPDDLFSIVTLPESSAPEEQPTATEDAESDSALQVPLIVPPVPPIKKEDEDVDGEGPIAETEDLLEQVIDELLGLP